MIYDDTVDWYYEVNLSNQYTILYCADYYLYAEAWKEEDKE